MLSDILILFSCFISLLLYFAHRQEAAPKVIVVQFGQPPQEVPKKETKPVWIN